MATAAVHNSSKNKLTPIRVFVRIRPPHANDGPKANIDCTPKEIHIKGQSRGYSFDQIFDDKSSQVKVYKTVVGKMIDDVMKGYNCTVFAYGQTGTGKTYTILGDDSIRNLDTQFNWTQENDAGIIVRAAAHLYEELDKMDPNIQRTVTVSFTEIYNEEIRDLLCDTELIPLRIYEDKSKVVHIKNLKEETVLNADDIIALLKKGCEKRQVAATQMNHRSSRSHTVFTINVSTIQTVSVVENLSNIICGKLNLIDLAGSENIAKSGSKEQRAREASNINQSLLTLGRVIKALVENSSHVPYRESKLTRILQDSLGGKTKTTIIATISPARSSMEETVNTLEYAFNARHVTNCPTINLRTSATAAAVQQELLRLKRDLFANANEQGVYMDKENYEEMTKSLTQCKQDIAVKHEAIKTLTEQLEDLTVQKEHWEKLRESFEITRRNYERCQSEIRNSKGKMKKDSLLLDYYESESAKLEEYADKLKQREKHFYKKLDSLYETSVNNQNVIEKIISIVESTLDDLVQQNNQHSQKSQEIISSLLGFNSKIYQMLNNVQKRLVSESEKYINLCEENQVDSDEEISTGIFNIRNYSEVMDKLKSFIKTCRDKVCELNVRIETEQGVLTSFEMAMKNLSDDILRKEVEANKICDENEINCENILNQMRKFSEEKDSLADYFRRKYEENEKEKEMIVNMTKMVEQMNWERKMSEYLEEQKRTNRRLADLASVKNNLGNAQESYQELLRIQNELVLDVHSLPIEQKDELLVNLVQNKFNEFWNVIKKVLQKFGNENSEVATVLDQISDILNVSGAAQVKQLEGAISLQTDATNGACVEVKQRTKQLFNTSVVRVAHVGDTPQRLDHPVHTRTRSSRNSLVRRLMTDQEEGDCFIEENSTDFDKPENGNS